MTRVFRHRIRVRYGECDPQGVVFNANYLAYFDDVLTEFFREAIGDYKQMLAEGADLVVAEANLRFRSPAAFDDEIDFALQVTRLGTTAMSVRIDARVGDRQVVEGDMRHVFVEPEGAVKREIPPKVRAAFEPYLAPPEREAAA